ncbi:hypothetical protein JOQ06_001701 [Pogonophryne albipinna]|uniref:Uncharacterized protein n=1 Tax=Pogonophryne albipinna TaxID=1090488 RepID=A0AAD6FKP1_9TELE|nr:hypothetical protein JOQ06_001701 [Pogonophryne albipinna]
MGEEVFIHCKLLVWDPNGLDSTKKACHFVKGHGWELLDNLAQSNLCDCCESKCKSRRQRSVASAAATSAVKHALHLSSAVSVEPPAVICPSQTRLMKPQERVFFKDPVKLIQSRLEHISQRTQMERVTAHFKHKSVELERHLKEVSEQAYRQLSELKRENANFKKQLSELKRETADLKKPLSQRRKSKNVTPCGCHLPSYMGSAESQVWARDRGHSLSSLTTPGSATSIHSHSSLHGHAHRTPISYNTPTR